MSHPAVDPLRLRARLGVRRREWLRNRALQRARVALARDGVRLSAFDDRPALLRALQPSLRVLCRPEPPQPYHMLHRLLALHGARLVTHPDRPHDVAVFFSTRTVTDPSLAPETEGDGVTPLNGRALDISKSHVGRVFEEVFGYGLTIDARVHHGPAVRKSERNYAHDGTIVTCPVDAPHDPLVTYQRLVDNRMPDGSFLDLRVTLVDHVLVLVRREQRAPDRRFGNEKSAVTLAEPDQVFDADERFRLERFSAAMGLDFCELDVLRDPEDGRIYVVDANSTPAGPTIVDPAADAAALGERRTTALRIIGDALLASLRRRAAGPARAP